MCFVSFVILVFYCLTCLLNFMFNRDMGTKDEGKKKKREVKEQKKEEREENGKEYK